MNDYIFLKISEMALRAIRAPKGHTWEYAIITVGGKIYQFDRKPYFVNGFIHYFHPPFAQQSDSAITIIDIPYSMMGKAITP